MNPNQTQSANSAPVPTPETNPSLAAAAPDSAPAGTPTAESTPPAEAAEPLAIPQTLTAEQIEDLTARAAKAEENWDRYVRAVAELDNYRKRVARERTELVQQANERLIRDLLPVLDNFEAALASATTAGQFESFKTGVGLILAQLRQVLGAAGVQEIDARGQPFDPAQHEALAHQDSREVPDGHVLQQVRKGYRLNGRLLRPASVIVARQPAA